jgi:hypothetical protein
MYLEICSNVHEEYVGKGDSMVHVNVRFWVDVNNVYWYSYVDICKLVSLNENVANRWYRYEMMDNEKCTCMDSNNYDQYNVQQPKPVDFITSETAKLVVQRHADYISERDNNIIKSLNNLECVGNAFEVFQDAEEIKQHKQKIYESIENNDYESFFFHCHKVSQTKTCRDTLSKRGVIDKDMEEALDTIREYLYNEPETKCVYGKNDFNDIIWEYDEF